MSTRNVTIWMVAVITLVLCGAAKAEWTTPVPVTEVNTEYSDSSPFLSFDKLTLYFTRRQTDTFYHTRIYEATREEPFGSFTSVREISELNSSSRNVIWPWVSPDNLRMYYSKSVARIIFSERASVDPVWPQGVDVTELNNLGKIYDPALTPDELIIFFHSSDLSGGQGGYDIWMATRPDRNGAFGNVTNLAEINTASDEMGPFVSTNGLDLYFSSDHNGDSQLFKATREFLNEPFGNVEHLSSFDTPGGYSANPCVSSDGSAFYFVKALDGKGDIYVSYLIEDPHELAVIQIEDAIAQKEEMLEVIDQTLEKEWAAYDALEELLERKDYGDLKKGDIVKAGQKIHSAIQHQQQSTDALEKSIKKLEDALTALGWEPEPQPEPDPNLVSYWQFDEGQGSIAYDSTGNNDGTIYGAQWTGGKIGDWALDFDGVDDYVDMADTVKKYLEVNYTVCAWIKTNTIYSSHTVASYRHSGHVPFAPFLFQLDHYNADVRFIVRDDSGNTAEATYPNALTTGSWYHVAGVRKGNALDVYVNAVSGTADSRTFGTISSINNLKIGGVDCCDQGINHLFDGVIDDVRIYDRALSEEEVQQLYQAGLN